MISFNLLYILILLGLVITIGNAFNSIFTGIKTDYLDIKYHWLSDLIYLIFLFSCVLLLIYLWKGNISKKTTQSSLLSLL